MHLVPTQEEVIELLRLTGGLRKGHFEYPNGLHTNEYLQVALTMRHYQSAKILSVGLMAVPTSRCPTVSGSCCVASWSSESLRDTAWASTRS